MLRCSQCWGLWVELGDESWDCTLRYFTPDWTTQEKTGAMSFFFSHRTRYRSSGARAEESRGNRLELVTRGQALNTHAWLWGTTTFFWQLRIGYRLRWRSDIWSTNRGAAEVGTPDIRPTTEDDIRHNATTQDKDLLRIIMPFRFRFYFHYRMLRTKVKQPFEASSLKFF